MKAAPRSQPIGGFTLIEMLVVLAIVAIIGSIAAPELARRYRTDNLEALAKAIITRIRAARTLAIATAKPQQIIVELDTKTIRFNERYAMHIPHDVKVIVTTGRETMIDDGRAILTFLPNGSASGIEIELSRSPEAQHIEVNWLTGLSIRKASR